MQGSCAEAYIDDTEVGTETNMKPGPSNPLLSFGSDYGNGYIIQHGSNIPTLHSCMYTGMNEYKQMIGSYVN